MWGITLQMSNLQASTDGLWDDVSEATAIMESLAIAKEGILDTKGLGVLLEDIQLALELLTMEVLFVCQTDCRGPGHASM
jgi:hypothetical protein